MKRGELESSGELDTTGGSAQAGVADVAGGTDQGGDGLLGDQLKGNIWIIVYICNSLRSLMFVYWLVG